jgi:hypothetical protein
MMPVLRGGIATAGLLLALLAPGAARAQIAATCDPNTGQCTTAPPTDTSELQ